jgi:hypothetical protein
VQRQLQWYFTATTTEKRSFSLSPVIDIDHQSRSGGMRLVEKVPILIVDKLAKQWASSMNLFC